MAKEIIFYESGTTTRLFPVTEASSVYDTETGFTVRQYLDDILEDLGDLEKKIPNLEQRVEENHTNIDEIGVAQETLTMRTIPALEERITSLEEGEISIDLSEYYTKVATDELLEAKQDLLIPQETLKTINGESLLGSGDIKVEDLGLRIEKITQAEYDSLTEYDPNILYAITDSETSSEGGTVNLSNYYTKSESDTKLQDLANEIWGSVEIDFCKKTYIENLGLESIPGRVESLESDMETVLSSGGGSGTSGGGLKIVETTMDNYNSLENKDPDTLYAISDAPGYYNKLEIDSKFKACSWNVHNPAEDISGIGIGTDGNLVQYPGKSVSSLIYIHDHIRPWAGTNMSMWEAVAKTGSPAGLRFATYDKDGNPMKAYNGMTLGDNYYGEIVGDERGGAFIVSMDAYYLRVETKNSGSGIEVSGMVIGDSGLAEEFGYDPNDFEALSEIPYEEWTIQKAILRLLSSTSQLTSGK